MAKFIFGLALFLTISIEVSAQCGKNMVFQSSKTEYLDGSYTVQRTVDENTVIEISKTGITIKPGDNEMSGTVKTDSCDWKTAWKEGKMIMSGTIVDQRGEGKEVKITLEGKEGKISFMVELLDNMDRKVRVYADRFEEKP